MANDKIIDETKSFIELNIDEKDDEYIITSKLLNQMLYNIDQERGIIIPMVNYNLDKLNAHTEFNYDSFEFELHIKTHTYRQIVDAYQIVIKKLLLLSDIME